MKRRSEKSVSLSFELNISALFAKNANRISIKPSLLFEGLIFFHKYLTKCKKSKKMSTAKITSKGQITIPKRIRDKLHLQKGDLLHLEVDEGKISVTPRKKEADEAFGILYREDQKAHTVNEMDKGVAQYFKDKYKQK